MTQLRQMHEKEKIEYVNQKIREHDIKRISEIAKSMPDEGIDIVKIMKINVLTENELSNLQDKAVAV